MRRKTAVKLLMAYGHDRNSANDILDACHKNGASNENCVHRTFLMHFKEAWKRGDYRFDVG